jgi:hypothetical protein
LSSRTVAGSTVYGDPIRARIGAQRSIRRFSPIECIRRFTQILADWMHPQIPADSPIRRFTQVLAGLLTPDRRSLIPDPTQMCVLADWRHPPITQVAPDG